MKSWKILLTLALTLIIVFSIIIYNAFSTDREFTILKNEELNFCLMADSSLKIDYHTDYIVYSGGKNQGVLRLKKGTLNETAYKVKNNGFESSVNKMKNKRVFEYKLNDEFILEDTFTYAAKSPLNLVPYRDECESIYQKFPKHQVIFKESL